MSLEEKDSRRRKNTMAAPQHPVSAIQSITFKEDSRGWRNELIALSQRLVAEGTPETGFLVSPLETWDFNYLGEDGLHSIVALRDGRPAGMLLFVEIGERSDAESLEVNQLLYRLRPGLNSKRGVFLEKLLVDPDRARQGIASALIGRLIENNPELDYILSSAVVEPRRNLASLATHRSLGFRELGTIGSDTEWLQEPGYEISTFEGDGWGIPIEIDLGSDAPDIRSMILLRKLDR
jgi:GNAT superfamily N-acetyltransferase